MDSLIVKEFISPWKMGIDETIQYVSLYYQWVCLCQGKTGKKRSFSSRFAFQLMTVPLYPFAIEPNGRGRSCPPRRRGRDGAERGHARKRGGSPSAARRSASSRGRKAAMRQRNATAGRRVTIGFRCVGRRAQLNLDVKPTNFPARCFASGAKHC